MILPEMVSRPDVYWPRPTTITATCDLGNLKNIDFNDDGASYTGKENMVNILLNCLTKVRTTDVHWTTNLDDIFVSVSKGIYADNQDTESIIHNRIDQALFRNPDDNGDPPDTSTHTRC